jgi:hypothetical protein
MLIRHTGIYVDNIVQYDHIFTRLGFIKIYDEWEKVNGDDVNIKKYFDKENNYLLELLYDRKFDIVKNSSHLCFYGELPDCMKCHYVVEGKPFNKKYKQWFVYVDDSIYFEFVKEKDIEL